MSTLLFFLSPSPIAIWFEEHEEERRIVQGYIIIIRLYRSMKRPSRGEMQHKRQRSVYSTNMMPLWCRAMGGERESTASVSNR
jgi:hypothetical protein